MLGEGEGEGEGEAAGLGDGLAEGDGLGDGEGLAWSKQACTWGVMVKAQLPAEFRSQAACCKQANSGLKIQVVDSSEPAGTHSSPLQPVRTQPGNGDVEGEGETAWANTDGDRIALTTAQKTKEAINKKCFFIQHKSSIKELVRIILSTSKEGREERV